MTLEFHLNSDLPAVCGLDCVIAGIFADRTLTTAAAALDTASDGRLQALLARGDISGKSGKTTLLHDLPGVAAPRVLL
ncbi:MAG: leucyl aminopeptidase, partial [Pseudomonadota bacterium]|nr:leucyl aminopeptidase [Pseudomonadota bacterium]